MWGLENVEAVGCPGLSERVHCALGKLLTVRMPSVYAVYKEKE